ncbi:MAG TPA: tripartite tricarboxylate transporter permease [Amaricoccus sp.]|uniref:tripartite tricarboxylate transporter permease n=1 Tax=Amaricoccus sp. TaxID=1872485 RepID=UPI002C4F5044|nr:tripartite tricarboxylate transporter permease [Amaricoccus sp.]HMR34233.1 tripartite tricarboxylate transporter permease [Geminicoccus sp.]HMU00773.1 tripartite tricarboxylate transporter permease [Amaricoccus sp.]
MIENLGLLLDGFTAALAPHHLVWIIAGTVMGVVIGALPGLGPTAGMAILLPVAFSMSPTSAIIMLGGIYYGAMYGGTITAVLLNIPGESDAVWTALEGHKLAKRGRAGATMVIAAVASFFAGTTSLFLLAIAATILAGWALSFGPVQLFTVLLLGLAMIIGLNARAPAKGYLMLAVGLVIGCVGFDIITGSPRLTFGVDRLLDGIDFLPVTVGMFGLAEVFANVERRTGFASTDEMRTNSLLPTRQEWRLSCWPAIRGTVLGFFVGIIPGTGTTIGATASYALERRIARRPEAFGEGAIEGVAGPEAANNAVTAGAMVPILSLGIPTTPATAVLLGAMLMQGLRPGPLLFRNSPDVVWTFIGSMYIGNFILLILTTLFIPVFTWLIYRSANLINAIVIVFCIVGVYASRNAAFDVWIMLLFGVIGYLLGKFQYPTVPLILGIVLGDAAELTLRQSLIMSGGNPAVFFSDPISATVLTLALAVILWPLVRAILHRRRVRQLAVAP